MTTAATPFPIEVSLMKTANFMARGRQHRGVLRDGMLIDAAGEAHHPDEVQFLLPVNPGKVIALALNYADHNAELGFKTPEEPVMFLKPNTSLLPHGGTVEYPRGAQFMHYEVELGIVIGKRSSYLKKEQAKSAIAGYFLSNDVSERVFQIERAGQWTKGKSYDTFGPVGPWLVTADEVKDPQKLHLWLELNGKRVQDGTTATMVFGVAHIVAYLSQFFTLMPGDIITTGTPPGVGMGIKPEPVFLKAGDVMTLGIEKLGEQRQDVIAWRRREA